MVWYESPRLIAAGFRHAFFTRRGGISPPPFDSLNFGYARSAIRPDGDAPDHLLANRRAAGLEEKSLRTVRQVHGCDVADARAAENDCEADAVLLEPGEGTAGVITADCCPVLLADPIHGRVAAIHAGWRGLVAGVIERTVNAMIERDSLACTLLAAVGPCIGPDAFEVGEEVADAVDERFGPEADLVLRRDGWPRSHVNLAAAAAYALHRAGLRSDSIDVAHLCTVNHPTDFFSHRRDGGRTGRMLNAISSKNC